VHLIEKHLLIDLSRFSNCLINKINEQLLVGKFAGQSPPSQYSWQLLLGAESADGLPLLRDPQNPLWTDGCECVTRCDRFGLAHFCVQSVPDALMALRIQIDLSRGHLPQNWPANDLPRIQHNAQISAPATRTGGLRRPAELIRSPDAERAASLSTSVSKCQRPHAKTILNLDKVGKPSMIPVSFFVGSTKEVPLPTSASAYRHNRSEND
jgi:hypothetical protein